MKLIKVSSNHKCIYMYIYIYIYIYITTKNNSNNVNDKNNSNSNERKWSHCLKETLLVACKFYIICMDIQRLPNSLFFIWRRQGSLIASITLVLNPIFLGLKTITIQYRDDKECTFSKILFLRRLYELFWTKMFLLEFLQTSLSEF